MILEAIQKVCSINRAHENEMHQLREWERAQLERIEREHNEHIARLHNASADFQAQIDATIRAHREQAARDKLEIDALLAEADDLIKRTRV